MSWELRIATIDQQLSHHFHKEQPILAGVPSKNYVIAYLIGWRNFALDLPCKTFDIHCIVTLANILNSTFLNTQKVVEPQTVKAQGHPTLVDAYDYL